jgi:hypothetical protein
MFKGSISKKEKSDALKKGIRKNEKEEEEDFVVWHRTLV